jgi:hypothetical protein
MYVQIVADDSFGVPHLLAAIANRGVIYAALRAAECDLRRLVAGERNALVRAEYERMLAVIRMALAEGEPYDGVHAN